MEWLSVCSIARYTSERTEGESYTPEAYTPSNKRAISSSDTPCPQLPSMGNVGTATDNICPPISAPFVSTSCMPRNFVRGGSLTPEEYDHGSEFYRFRSPPTAWTGLKEHRGKQNMVYTCEVQVAESTNPMEKGLRLLSWENPRNAILCQAFQKHLPWKLSLPSVVPNSWVCVKLAESRAWKVQSNGVSGSLLVSNASDEEVGWGTTEEVTAAFKEVIGLAQAQRRRSISDLCDIQIRQRGLAECAICFEHITDHPVAYLGDELVNGDRVRTCKHVFHYTCSEQLVRNNISSCPICKTPFSGFFPFPTLDGKDSDPQAWFDLVADSKGKLSKDDVAPALEAVLPLDYIRLRKQLMEMWKVWDLDGDGYIQRDEFFDPVRGLLRFVEVSFDYLSDLTELPMKYQEEEMQPDFFTETTEWFTFWDTNEDGCLEKDEVLRAIIKSLSLSSTPTDIFAARCIVEELWPQFDPDDSGSIDAEEFLRPQVGLAAFMTQALLKRQKTRGTGYSFFGQ